MIYNNKNTFFEFVIIGAGFGGLGAAIRLKKENKANFIVLERAAELGGTWRDNTYPGCGCDVPSRLYSFSFDLNPDWSRGYSRQAEILAYLKQCAHKYSVYEKIKFNTAVNDLRFDEDAREWHVKTNAGDHFRCRIIISATGPLNRPVIPDFNGLDTFQGTVFHTSRWPENFNPDGKKVAVIGTGASAIQIVPAIVNQVGKLCVFQRTPAWVLPKRDGPVSSFRKKLYRHFPIMQKIARGMIYYFNEVRGLGFWGSSMINNLAEAMGRRYLKKTVVDPELRKKLTPDYAIGCKRVLPSDDFYTAIQKENVTLITENIQEIHPGGIMTNAGNFYELDTIAFATGFRAASDLVAYPVQGLNGIMLDEQWKENGLETYYGISVSGFPNLFLLAGPNTGLGHTSVVVMIEAQMNYVIDYVRKLNASGKSYFNVKSGAQKEFSIKIQEDLSGTVWASGCKSWYLDEHGKNTTLWPGSTIRYRRETRNIRLEDFTII